MRARIKLAVPFVLCSLVFGLWLAIVSLPTDLVARRAYVLLWFAAYVVVTLASLWWAFGKVVARPIARLLDVVRNTGASGNVVPTHDSLTEIDRRVQALLERAVQSDAALVAETQARLAAEAALKETEQRYVLAVRGANDGLWEWDIATGNMFLSPRWRGMLGFGESDLAGNVESWRERIHKDDRPAVEHALQAHVDTQTTRFESEHRLVHKDGSERWVLSRGTALRHASGRAYRMIGLDADTTHYKRVETVMQHVAAGTANALGAEFYRALVMHFAQALNISEVFVTECVDQPPTHVRTLACWERGQFINDQYELATTPCEIIFDTKERYFVPRDLALHFPNEGPYGFVSYLGMPIFDSQGHILGHLVFKDDKPMDEGILMDAVYRIFTARAGAEMERSSRETELLRVVDGFAALASSEDRLRALVVGFAKYVGAREAFITHCLDEPPTRVRALCYWNNGEVAYNIDYDLPGTPCESVYGDGQAVYWPKQLAERWPMERDRNRNSYFGLPLTNPFTGRVFGHLACCHDKPLSEHAPPSAIYKLFTQRATEELLRCL